MKSKKQIGRIELPKGKTLNERAKDRVVFHTAKNAGPLERLLARQRGLSSVEAILQHCEMCGADAGRLLEPAFAPDGKAEMLCQDCRIGSAELLADRRQALLAVCEIAERAYCGTAENARKIRATIIQAKSH